MLAKPRFPLRVLTSAASAGALALQFTQACRQPDAGAGTVAGAHTGVNAANFLFKRVAFRLSRAIMSVSDAGQAHHQQGNRQFPADYFWHKERSGKPRVS